MEGQYSILDLSKTRLAVRSAAVRANARKITFWCGLVGGWFTLLFLVFLSGSVLAKLGAPPRLPLSLLIAVSIAALSLGFASFRALMLQWHIGRICEEKLRKSGLLERLAAGELEDITKYYFWPWKRFASKHKQAFSDIFYRAVLNIDWYCHPPRPVLPKEFAAQTATILLMLAFVGCVDINFFSVQPNKYPLGFMFQMYFAVALAIAGLVGTWQAADFAVAGEVAKVAQERLEL